MSRILVIEDSPDAQLLLEGILRSAGHEVLTADEGEAGLALYREGRTDLVITDLLMPGKEGMETIQSLRRCDPAARIIAVSGGGAALLAMAGGLGARRTLAKPFLAAELLTAVREVLAV
jgi:DNA-binding response OmpR family regulator